MENREGSVHSILIAGRDGQSIVSLVSRHFDGSQRDSQVKKHPIHHCPRLSLVLLRTKSMGLTRRVVAHALVRMQVEWEAKIFEACMRDMDLTDPHDERPMACSVGDRQEPLLSC
jgi:hypothetical protein